MEPLRVRNLMSPEVVTLRRDGLPIALPMWFVALERRIFVRTLLGSKKVARIERDPRVAFLVEEGERWAELRAVHFTGRASRVADRDLAARVEAAMERKYAAFRTARAAMPDATREHYERPYVHLAIDVDERFLSWDNRRLATTGRRA